MLIKLNNKSLINCEEKDLKVLIDNPDFRENEYIDYKETFSFLMIKDNNLKNEKIIEFKNDVCQFANSEGGYLIYGISDTNGCADKIIGVCVPQNDTDKFELDMRNKLSGIYPKIPDIRFNFINLNNGKYVVIIYVKRDGYAPYLHIEKEKNYKIYVRSGNQKRLMTYTELKNMFNQSLSLDREIAKYREERVKHYSNSNDCTHFLLLHFIPDTFMDSSYTKNMYALYKYQKIKMRIIFSDFNCDTYVTPCVDGVRFLGYYNENKAEGYVYNNGIVECYYPLESILHIGENSYPNGFIPSQYLWDMIKPTCRNYFDVFSQIDETNRVFVCLSIIGCKGVQSQYINFSGQKTYIDRNDLFCKPVCIKNENCIKNDTIMKKLYIEFMLSIGITNDKELNDYLEEIYSE